MGLLESSGAWLNAQMLKADAPAGTVTYQPAGDPLPPAIDLTGKVTLGQTLFVNRTPNGRGPSVVWGERDYFIAVADLPGRAPAKGDRITEVINGETVTFEVLPTLGEPEQRYTDATQTAYRVHTKRVAT